MFQVACEGQAGLGKVGKIQAAPRGPGLAWGDEG